MTNKNVEETKIYKNYLDLINYIEMILEKYPKNVKMLKIYARISYKKKYINLKNYESWSRKINQVGINLGTWINICVKQ